MTNADALAGSIELSTLFDGLLDMVGRGACDAALRCIRDLFPAQHHMETARALRRRGLVLLAQCADLRADRQSARRSPEELSREESDLEARARDYLDAARSFAKGGRIEPERIERALVVFGQARAEIRIAGGSAGGPILIFISYRRDDSGDVAGFIAERLKRRFGDHAIFMDVSSIPFGVNYRAYIVSTLAKCKACLVIIGPQWLDVCDPDGRRRIEDQNDLVRIEVETALRLNVPVAPLLVRGATFPPRDQLPEAIAELRLRNGLDIRPHPDFDNDMQRLMSRLEEQLL